MVIFINHLQTSAPAHSYRRTAKTVSSAFRAPINELFVEFDEQPVASGSIGQVNIVSVCS